jgi:hypothetical protein
MVMYLKPRAVSGYIGSLFNGNSRSFLSEAAAPSLVGRSGTQMDGWLYELEQARVDGARPRPLRSVERDCAPAADAPRACASRARRSAAPTRKAGHAAGEGEVRGQVRLEQGITNVLEYLMKHLLAPLAGAVVLLGSMMADEPVPPQIPEGLYRSRSRSGGSWSTTRTSSAFSAA